MMSQLTETIQALSNSQALLKEFARQMEQDATYGKEVYREKINDIRDYANGLAIVTYLVPAQAPKEYGEESLMKLLRGQLGQIENVIQALNSETGAETAQVDFDLKESDIRRMTSSLRGMIEMNNLLRLEEEVQLVLKEPVAKATAQAKTTEKKGFFQKLFGH